MLVLGFNGGNKTAEEDDVMNYVDHDAAAVLMENGEVLSAIEEERLNRVKHTNCFPSSAIRYCMQNSGVKFEDLDCIVRVGEEKRLVFNAQWDALQDMRDPIPAYAREVIARNFIRDFGIDISSKLRFCDHHDAHLWSAFAQSGFEEALVISIDGEGDGRSGVVCLGRNNAITELRSFRISQSLGVLYTAIIRLLGFGSFDEYKAMGLAPYGDPSVYQAVFDEGYRLLDDGDYELDTLVQWAARFAEAGIIKHARRVQEPFDQFHMDIAATLQSTLERILMHVLAAHRKTSGQTSLCMAGGVAHNCTFNGNILRSGLFERVFVQPAAHDAGGALGAACWTQAAQGSPGIIKPMKHMYLGSHIGEDDVIERHLKSWSSLLDFRLHRDIVKETALLLASGSVVGWAQGRSEFGPRALGHRSILADPRPTGNKDLINAMVKKREQFRPFAPSVIEEEVGKYFEVPDCEADLGYMTYVLKVREPYRSLLGAVTHIDGTARLQTVSHGVNSTYWDLLSEFGCLTGFPILLNTSFNNNAEPIVNSIYDAVSCFLTTGLDSLVIGNFLAYKRVNSNGKAINCASSGSTNAYLDLIPVRPVTRRLVQMTNSGDVIYKLETTKAVAHVRRPEVSISEAMFLLLSRADGICALGELLGNVASLTPCSHEQLMEELLELWSKRMVSLYPAGLVPGNAGGPCVISERA